MVSAEPRMLHRHGGDPARNLSLLSSKGYVWRADSDNWTPGIPSLMEYMIELTESDPHAQRMK